MSSSSCPYPDRGEMQEADSQQHDMLRYGDVDFEAQHQADGYFHGSASHQNEWSPSPMTASIPSNQVPHVPNVEVHDPSLRPGSTIEDKAIGMGRDMLRHPQSPLHPATTEASSSTGPAQTQLRRLRYGGDDDDDDDDLYSYSPSTLLAARRNQGWEHASQSSNGARVYEPVQSHSQIQPDNTPASPASSRSRTSSRRLPFSTPPPVIPGEAPPAYSPRSPNTAGTGASTYSAFPPNRYNPSNNIESPVQMGLPEETSPLIGDSGLTPPPRRGTPRYKDTKKRHGKLLFLVILLVGVMVLLSVPMGFWSRHSRYLPIPPNEPVRENPKTPDVPGSPETTGVPHTPESPDQPSNGPTDEDGVPITLPHSMCKGGVSGHVFPMRSFDVTFASSKPLEVSQVVRRTNLRTSKQLGISGTVVVRSLADGRGNAVQKGNDGQPGFIDVKVATNMATLDQEIEFHFQADDQRLEISLPREVRLDWDSTSGQSLASGSMPCVVLDITIWVPENDAALALLGIHTVHLDLYLARTLQLATEELALDTVVGDIRATKLPAVADYTSRHGAESRREITATLSSYQLHARDALLRTTSGDITGPWFLGENLRLATVSGDINITVTPLPMKKKGYLVIQTTSGDVTLDEVGVKDGDVPLRDYETTAETGSGQINAVAAFSSLARFATLSGDMKVELLPVVNKNNDGVWMALSTETKSGDTKIHLLDGLFYNSDTGAQQRSSDLRALASKHEAVSGDIKLMFPSLWRGFIHLAAGVGDLSVAGDDFMPTKLSWKGPHFGQILEGLNGVKSKDEAGYIESDTTSGDIKLCFRPIC